MAASVANYDYIVDWQFQTDGLIRVAVCTTSSQCLSRHICLLFFHIKSLCDRFFDKTIFCGRQWQTIMGTFISRLAYYMIYKNKNYTRIYFILYAWSNILGRAHFDFFVFALHFIVHTRIIYYHRR